VALEKELELFEAKLPEFKGEHQGEFVLIGGGEVVDFFSGYDDALKAGYAKFGIATPFLVKQVLATEQVHFITRVTARCA
jgi:hypothetical protein